ncbi:Arc family DNA-binding protein [Pseudomonas sp. NY15437]|uniref:Arc family DNA-binding protein n=1 Tax=Pseudomonas sp. NY15437 TaxID=3400360 RepID=UPI003A869641
MHLANIRGPKVQDGKSRTADKINVRLPDGVRDQIIEICKAEHIAMNTFVVQALEEKLARDAGLVEALAQLTAEVARIGAHLGISNDAHSAGSEIDPRTT